MNKNTWEPENNFASAKIVIDYHERKEKLARRLKRSQSRENKPIDEFVAATFIAERKLVPKKVLNITHLKGEEKVLVAQVMFQGFRDPTYVYARWANRNCPHLVIAYYESRIHWEKKS